MASERDAPDPAIARALAALSDREPAHDLWPAIAPRLKPRLPRGTVLVRWPAAVAAGLLVAFGSATATWVVLHSGAPAPAPHAAASEAAPALATAALTAPADSALIAAIAELEEMLARHPERFDPAVRASLAQSIRTIDGAIADVRQARAAAPDDAWTARYLTATLRRKFDMLRTAVVRSGTAL